MSSYPGAIDSFTTKVDAVTDVLAAHVNDLQNSGVAEQTELGVNPAGQYTDVVTRLDTLLAETENANIETLSGNKTLVDGDSVLQILDPGADRDVTLPAESATGNHWFWIYNDASATGEDITVKDDTPTTLGVIGFGRSAVLISDGTSWFMIHLGAGTGVQTIWIPASAMKPEVTNGCGDLAQAELTAAQPERLGLPYDGAAAEYAQFSIAMPTKWDEGTITFIPYWTTTAVDTDGVYWTLQAVALADGDALQTAFGTLQSSTDAGQSTANDVYIGPESSAITVDGSPTAGEIVFFRMGRDPTNGADTIIEDCFLLGIKVMYTVDKGSDD